MPGRRRSGARGRFRLVLRRLQRRCYELQLVRPVRQEARPVCPPVLEEERLRLRIVVPVGAGLQLVQYLQYLQHLQGAASAEGAEMQTGQDLRHLQ